MKQQKLNIVAVQCDVKWEDISANIASVSKLVKRHAKEADLLVFPEMFLSGFTMNALECAVSMVGEEINLLVGLAVEYKVAIAGSVVVRENSNFFNRFLWLDPSGTIEFYDKKHLFTYANEQQHYTAGSSKLVVNYKGWNIACFVCYDLRFPVWTRNVAGGYEYDVVIFVANWPAKRSKAWKTLLKARAIENQSYVIGVNRIGTDGSQLEYSGDSVVLNYEGDEMGKISKEKGGEIITASIDKESVVSNRKEFPFLNDADKFELK